MQIYGFFFFYLILANYDPKSQTKPIPIAINEVSLVWVW